MAEESYRLVFRGELVEGVSRAEAEANLKSRFNYSDSALAKLFAGKGVVLKSCLDQLTAEKYEKALAGVGLVCEVQAAAAVDAAEPAKPAPAVEAPVAPAEVAVAQEEPMAEPEAPGEEPARDSGPDEEPVPAPVEAAPVEAAPAASRQDSTGNEPADAFEPESVEYPPVQEDADQEFGISGQSEESEESEGFFATATVVSAAAQEQVDGSAVAPQTEISGGTGEDFAAEQVPPAPVGEAAFFEESQATAGPVGAGILQILQQTKPWVRLISVLLFISSGLGLLAFAVVLVGGFLGGMGSQADTPMMLMFVVQALSLLLYLIPAYFLFKYASAIGTLLKGGGETELETALRYQKSFWRFSGILTLIFLVLGGLGVLAAILIPTLMRF